MPILPVERSVTPHNVWDRWIELYGRDLNAFYPVADTGIWAAPHPPAQEQPETGG